MFYPDLATECQVDVGPNVRAVGWLGRHECLQGVHVIPPFTVGEVDSDFMDKLREHVRDAWQPVLICGPHERQ